MKMKKNYISPEMTVSLFFDAIGTADTKLRAEGENTSAVLQAQQYMLNLNDAKVREVLIMK